MPERIQLRRTKGWRLPADTITVSRPTKWGNPFQIGSNKTEVFVHDGTRVHRPFPRSEDSLESAHGFAVSLYRSWLESGTLLGLSHWGPPLDLANVRRKVLGDIRSLTGRDLACWCAPWLPCHADVLLELANQGANA